jgi:predicted dinucleotide-binding enzyme
MAHVTILGSGNMGQAIASVLGKGGSTVQVLDTSEAGTAVAGEIVVLAVPHAAIADIVAARGDQLVGKTIVDITNPVNFETFHSLVVPADSSAAAQLAAQLPKSHVLKAFNTNFAGTLASGKIGDVVTTVLVAGDDADAKTQLVDIVKAAGLNAIDAGALSRARELESLGFLQITLAAAEKIAWSGGFAVTA